MRAQPRPHEGQPQATFALPGGTQEAVSAGCASADVVVLASGKRLVALGRADNQVRCQTELEAEVTDLIVLGLSQIGDQTAAELLAEAGVSDAWRPELETRLTTLARGFSATPAFEDWLSAVLQD